MFFIRIAFPVLIPFVLAACASKEVRMGCEQKDWYEIGRRDGAQGVRAEKLDEYRGECDGDLKGNNEMIYLNGRNAGLVEYCQPESGFQLGRAGQPYDHVCPVTVEAPFLAAYERGRKARQIEQRSKDIDAQIENLSNKLLRADRSHDQKKLSSELKLLRQARTRADRELDKVAR